MLLDEIMRKCMAKPNSLNTRIIYGLAHSITLDLDEVEKYREFVIDFLDNIISEGEIINASKFNLDRNGNKWGSPFEGELLIMLGKALDLIKLVPDSRGLPNVVRDGLNKVSVMK